MLKKYGGTIGILFLFFFTSITLAEEYASEKTPPSIAARIGGTLTVLDIRQITDTDCNGFVWSDSTLCEEFTIKVTRPDGSDYSGANTSELNPYNQYIINIPIKNDGDVDGAAPGDKAVIHVYDKNVELQVKSPYNGEIIVGESGYFNQIDLLVQKICIDPCTDNKPKIYTQEELDVEIEKAVNDEPKLYTQEALDAAVNEERQKWDANNDQHIGLEEAIRALQILSGVRSHPGR